MAHPMLARAAALALLVASPAALAFPGGPPPAPGERLDAVLDAVDADDGQRATLRELAHDTFQRLHDLHEEGHAIRSGLREALTAEVIDRVAIEDLRLRAVALFDDGTSLALDALADGAEVLTADQRVQLRGFLEDHESRMRAHHDRMRARHGALDEEASPLQEL